MLIAEPNLQIENNIPQNIMPQTSERGMRSVSQDPSKNFFSFAPIPDSFLAKTLRRRETRNF